MIGTNSANTPPPAKLQAFEEDGLGVLHLEKRIEKAAQTPNRLNDLDIDLEETPQQPLNDSADSFIKSRED